MSESSSFEVTSTQHRVLGKQVRLQLAADYVLKLTPAEASSLSFALVAVRNGISPEREIYMSPIASDDAFDGRLVENGMRIKLRGTEIDLDRDRMEALAAELACAIG